MKSFVIALAVSTTLAGSVAAEGQFAGTWKLNVDKSQLAGDTMSYTRTPTGYHVEGGPAPYDFAVDGKDYPMMADRTVAWTAAGDRAWDSVIKAGNVTLSKSHRTLSADGRTLAIIRTLYRPDGATTEETDTFERVSGGPGLAGKWKDVKVKAASETMTIKTPGPGRFEIDYPAYKQTIVGSTDGSAATVTGPTIPAGASAMYKAEGPATWTYQEAFNGKVFAMGTLSVSNDGATLTNTNWLLGKKSEAAVEVYDRQ